ncbi:cation:proton antiporter [Pontiellaceae bacterium B12219]|nr:cation:proton antiporter [Pontiellaceae bacterium B12219]
MSVISGLVFVCLFLIALCAITHYFRNSRLPVVCWIVLFGALYGVVQRLVIPALPEIRVSPDVILFIFLPVLIFDSTRKLKVREARAMAVPSTALATFGILVSMGVMAVPIRLYFDMPWIDILFFCGIMSATDPVAVSAIFSVIPVPEKLKMLIESESLLNDGTTVVLFTVLYARVVDGQTLLLGHGLMTFVMAVLGAIVMGIVVGWACMKLMHQWVAFRDSFIAPLLPLLFIYLIFCIAQAGFDISGVIAVMAATLTMKKMVFKYAAEERPAHKQLDFYRGFWSFLNDLANALLFFILGSEIGSHSYDIAWLLMLVALASLLLSRCVVAYGFGALFNVARFRIPMSWLHVLNLGGLKGALSVALILMIPREYVYRDVFLLAALVMCLFTLIVNTLGLRMYLKKADLGEIG